LSTGMLAAFPLPIIDQSCSAPRLQPAGIRGQNREYLGTNRIQRKLPDGTNEHLDENHPQEIVANCQIPSAIAGLRLPACSTLLMSIAVSIN